MRAHSEFHSSDINADLSYQVSAHPPISNSQQKSRNGQASGHQMDQELLSFVVDVGKTLMRGVPISLALALVFTVLTWFWACNPGRPWWRKPDLITDLCYWLFIPVIARFLR